MTRCPVSVRLLLPALLVVLPGCGGSAEVEAVAAPPVCAAAAALPAGTAPGAVTEAAAGVPRPVGARDDRELSELTPEQAALVQQLHQAEQAEQAGQAGHGGEGSRAHGPGDEHAAEGHRADGPAAGGRAAAAPHAAPAPCASAQGEAGHGEPAVEHAPAEGGH